MLYMNQPNKDDAPRGAILAAGVHNLTFAEQHVRAPANQTKQTTADAQRKGSASGRG